MLRNNNILRTLNPLHMREKIKYEAVRSIKTKVGGFTGTDDYYI